MKSKQRIDTKTGRAALDPRAEPYWHKHAEGRHLGYRKVENGPGYWVARYRYAEGDAPAGKPARPQEALGECSDTFGFDQAMAKALAWFKERDQGITGKEAETVAAVCELYVEDRRKQKGEGTAKDYQRAFERSVYGGGGKAGDKHEPNAIGSVSLAKFKSRHLEAWRDGLVDGGMTKVTANRMRTRLVAALHYAVRKQYVGPAILQELRSVQAFKGVAGRRDLYLDLEQRRALLKAATGAVRDLIEAVVVTGARAGELVSARRPAFDARTKALTLTGKTGTRIIPLSPTAATLFERLARGKLPAAFLLSRDDGRHWSHSDWDELVRAAAAAAKLPAGVCLYTLRHSWITAALTDGISPLEVAKLVGTSLAMIDRNYGHLAHASAREHLARVVMV